MITYSLLQDSLGQTISREALEEASMVVPSVSRADAPAIVRGLFGIIVSGMPRADALAFQRELAGRKIPTEVVEDRAVPLLHEAFRIQRLEIRDEVLVFTDAAGRVQERQRHELVFAAGGPLLNIRFQTEKKEAPYSMFSKRTGYRGRAATTPVTRSWEETVSEFRLDFFFSGLPNRLCGVVSERSVMFLHGRPLRLRERALLLGAMMDCRSLLPPERLNEGLKQCELERSYPSLQAYEEEIRWHFHRLIARG
jgi:hypothetical protein